MASTPGLKEQSFRGGGRDSFCTFLDVWYLFQQNLTLSVCSFNVFGCLTYIYSYRQKKCVVNIYVFGHNSSQRTLLLSQMDFCIMQNEMHYKTFILSRWLWSEAADFGSVSCIWYSVSQPSHSCRNILQIHFLAPTCSKPNYWIKRVKIR